MARKLVFSVDNALQFRLSHEGFLTARGANRQEHKTIDKVLEKFESISIEEEDRVPGFDPNDPLCPKRRHLDPEKDGVIIFEDAEYDYFKKHLEQLSCNAPMSRILTKLFQQIDEAPAGDAKVLAASA